MPEQKYTDSQIIDAVANSSNMSQAARLLGTHPETIRKRVKRLGISNNHHSRASYTDDQLTDAVADNKSYRAVLLALGLKESGGAYQHLKRKIEALGLDVSHFLGKASNRGEPSKNRKTADELLQKISVSDPKPSARMLRRALLEKGMEERCVKCGQPPEWQGEPLRLQVDHVNGDNRDNELSNLRFLCPNCHTQTPTWGSKPA